MVQVKIGFLTAPSDFNLNKENLELVINSEDLMIKEKADIEKKNIGIIKMQDYTDFIGGVGIYQLETVRNRSFEELLNIHVIEQNIYEDSDRIFVYRDFYFLISKKNGLIFIYSNSALPKDNICKYFFGLLNKVFSNGKKIENPEFFTFPEDKFDEFRKIMLNKKCEEHKLVIEHEKYEMLASGSLHKDKDLERIKEIRKWRAWKYIGFEISHPNITFFQFPKNTTKKFILRLENFVSLKNYEIIYEVLNKFRKIFNLAIGKKIEFLLYPMETTKKLDKFF